MSTANSSCRLVDLADLAAWSSSSWQTWSSSSWQTWPSSPGADLAGLADLADLADLAVVTWS